MSQEPGWLRPHGEPWKRVSERLVYDNPWITVTEHQAVAPTGKSAIYGVVSFKNLAMAVLPLFDDGSTVLVGQHRFAHRDYSWEIPEGGGPRDVDPLESAKRELREEAGLEAAQWLPVMKVQLSNAITDEIAIGYIATGLSPVPTDPDETEELALVRVPFREALEAALAGQLPDVMTVAMLLRAYHMARERALPDALSRAMLG
ncbi:NUDIX hydrolase [Phenylobacterium sp.]|jgi:8-oxo-dGTP pyrophosphatase MutT (NUDIX family)|uniref:NUDIX hydrolase n=1 Tax=Phenylobacterium sp. TaxID=1871053 RepID=UPI002E32365C|nr:NUDIX hydrolase [Phenylobacterium sp.]HEX2559648.1 NUDIX hydrolase [Phenylobacterium sp.]